MRRIARENVGEAIQVEIIASVPVRVVWRGTPYRVLNVDGVWCAEGKWWLDSSRGGLHRRYYRLSIASPSREILTIEVYQQHGVWKLWRLAD